MTKDMNEMKKKRGRPALGRTRKLTKGVTVKFSPVSYEALRFRARKSGRSLAVYIREVALAATVTARHTPEEMLQLTTRLFSLIVPLSLSF